MTSLTSLSCPTAPGDIGLSFASYRPQQVEAINRTLDAFERGKKYVFLQAPPGTGKTLIAASVAKILSGRTLYTVSTIQLQEQLGADFPFAAILRGQSNYPCAKSGFHTKADCDIGAKLCISCSVSCEDQERAKGSLCKCDKYCLYEQALLDARRSSLLVINYALLLSVRMLPSSVYNFAVYDEADLMENALRSHISVSISQKTRDKLEIPLPKYKTKYESWTIWAKLASVKVLKEIQRLFPTSSDRGVRKEITYLIGLQEKLAFMALNLNEHWVYTGTEDRISFRPVRVIDYSGIFWTKPQAQNYLAMSALFPPKTMMCTELHLEQEQIEFVELNSAFPVESRKIYYWPVAEVTFKKRDTEWPKLVDALDRLLDTYWNVKVLLHAVNYGLSTYVYYNSRHKARMLTHKTENRALVLDQFRHASKPLVLVSPSMERGVDLKNDECRLVVILKMPAPDLKDKQVSTRLYGYKDGELWYQFQIISGVVQGSARATRSEDDWSCIYVLDSKFGELYQNRWTLFPGYWRDAVTVV